MTDVYYDLPLAGSVKTAIPPAADPQAVPAYLAQVYHWAYLSPRWVPVLDHPLVVQMILWGNADRLMNSAVLEFAPGQRVLQPASVYGDFSTRLARQLGPNGHLTVADVAPIQVNLCRRKLGHRVNVNIRQANAALSLAETFDGVCCFFLLHEVPQDYKRRIVDSLLGTMAPGGKAVFVDYHRPHRWHPLRPVMWAVFALLEPFATNLTNHDIRDFATAPQDYVWSKQTFFGGLYQKVTARRLPTTEPTAAAES